MKLTLFFRFFKIGMLFFGLVSGIYFLLALLGALIPVNQNFSQTQNGIPVFVTTNGFHTDVVLPIQNQRDKCFRVLEHPDFAGKYANYQYVSFGWGSRNFFLESFSGFPSATTTVSTVFIPNKTLMHIEFYRNPLSSSENVKKILLSETEYEKLVSYVYASFAEKEGFLEKLSISGYGENDFFFHATGNYHLFNTCNIWTGKALGHAGIKVSAWTPFESGVLFHLR